jgi:hypothetical protein
MSRKMAHEQPLPAACPAAAQGALADSAAPPAPKNALPPRAPGACAPQSATPADLNAPLLMEAKVGGDRDWDDRVDNVVKNALLSRSLPAPGDIAANSSAVYLARIFTLFCYTIEGQSQWRVLNGNGRLLPFRLRGRRCIGDAYQAKTLVPKTLLESALQVAGDDRVCLANSQTESSVQAESAAAATAANSGDEGVVGTETGKRGRRRGDALTVIDAKTGAYFESIWFPEQQIVTMSLVGDRLALPMSSGAALEPRGGFSGDRVPGRRFTVRQIRETRLSGLVLSCAATHLGGRAMKGIRKLLCAAALVVSVNGAGASAVVDDFEGYALGSFPSPTWSDVGSVQNNGQTLPSARVVSTTNAFGAATQAVAINDQLGSSRGIYAATDVGRFYSLAADIRVDRYSANSQGTTQDWAMQLTFAHSGVGGFDGTPQAGIYASALTQGWRLFLIGEQNLFADIDLGLAAQVGTWYRVSLDADALTGAFHTRIFDVLSNTLLLDNTQTLGGWTPGEAHWDSIAFFGGDLSGTTPDQAVVDNVNIASSGTVPEPATAALGAAALLAMGVLRRSRR